MHSTEVQNVYRIARSSCLAIAAALISQVFVTAAGAAEAGKESIVLSVAANQPPQFQSSNPPNKPQVIYPSRDSYSLAPQVQDAESTHFLTDVLTATTHSFDGRWKSAGFNRYGSAGGTVGIIESIWEDDYPNSYVIGVQVSALNAQGQFEPWVSAEHAEEGLTSWRLDVAKGLGGTNLVNPGAPYTVLLSGVDFYDTQARRLASFERYDDTSDASGLSGTIVYSEEGVNIAGYDLASVVMWWRIEDLSADSVFDVTAGQSGAWSDPSHRGEGFLLQILSDEEALLYWFTYDSDGKQRWMFGVGDIEGSKISFALYTTSGGKFGPDFDPEDVEFSFWSGLVLDFTDCNHAIASYDGGSLAGGFGRQNLQRLTRIWGEDCYGSNIGATGTGIGDLSPRFSGSWRDLTHRGEGFTVDILDEDTALIYWFTYDTQGNQAWMFAEAAIDGATIIAKDILITSGGKYGPDFDPDDVVLEHWGEATFTFEPCATSPDSAGQMSYKPPAAFGPESTQFLNRLTYIDGLVCDVGASVW